MIAKVIKGDESWKFNFFWMTIMWQNYFILMTLGLRLWA